MATNDTGIYPDLGSLEEIIPYVLLDCIDMEGLQVTG
jgi:hypothetical protein